MYLLYPQHPDCLGIAVPPDDWFYGPYGVRCLEFVRSMATSRVGCSLGPRDQINQVTSFIDGSVIYGSSETEEDNLRLFRNGMLINLYYNNKIKSTVKRNIENNILNREYIKIGWHNP